MELEPRPPIDWDAQPLGQMPDAALARSLGVSATAVRYHRDKRGIPPFTYKNVNWNDVPLGEETDVALAKRLGVSSRKVAAERNRRGIPPWKHDAYTGIDWDAQPLGDETDGSIARKLGVPLHIVAHHRRCLGIAGKNRGGPGGVGGAAIQAARRKQTDMEHIRQELSIIRSFISEIYARTYGDMTPFLPDDLAPIAYGGDDS